MTDNPNWADTQADPYAPARSRLYRLADNREIDTRQLTLVTQSDGPLLYAFTFTSCVAGT